MENLKLLTAQAVALAQLVAEAEECGAIVLAERGKAALLAGELSPLTVAALRSELEARRTTTPGATDLSGNVAVG